MNEIDVIKGAREILAAGRWHKGALWADGNMCIIGALCTYSNDRQYTEKCEQALIAHLPEHFRKNRLQGLALYNDDPNTTLQDMLDLIDKTLADKGAL